jgi:hypothetical protein
MRSGYGGEWTPVPNYHPYIVIGDFNSDGIEDFAVGVVSRSKPNDFTLLVFNGPIESSNLAPAFVGSGLDLRHSGLFYGPPRPKPYRLLMGHFESEGTILVPHGRTYQYR